MKDSDINQDLQTVQETDREKMQERELRRKRWIIAMLLVLAVVLALTLTYLLLTRGEDKIEKTKVPVLSANKTEIVIPVTINGLTVNCVIDKESENTRTPVIITRNAARVAGCKVENNSNGTSVTQCAIRCGDRVIKNVYAQVKEGAEPEIKVSLGWFRMFFGKIKIKQSIAIISGSFTGHVIDSMGKLVSVTGYSESHVKGIMMLTFAGVLLIFYIVGRVLMSKEMLVITVGSLDKFLIFAAALALLVSVFANDVDGGEKIANISLAAAGIAMALSLGMTVMANITHPICMIIAVFAKIFVVLFILFVLFVLLAALIVSIAASAANREDGGWEVIGWSDTLDAYVGIKR